MEDEFGQLTSPPKFSFGYVERQQLIRFIRYVSRARAYQLEADTGRAHSRRLVPAGTGTLQPFCPGGFHMLSKRVPYALVLEETNGKGRFNDFGDETSLTTKTNFFFPTGKKDIPVRESASTSR